MKDKVVVILSFLGLLFAVQWLYFDFTAPVSCIVEAGAAINCPTSSSGASSYFGVIPPISIAILSLIGIGYGLRPSKRIAFGQNY
jgi:hypothetical protein